MLQRPNKEGRFGRYGGQYVPETLIQNLRELEAAYHSAKDDPEFQVTHVITHPYVK